MNKENDNEKKDYEAKNQRNMNRRNKKKDYKRSRNQRRGKEFEINVPDKSVNMADLKHVDAGSSRSGNDFSWYNQIPALVKDSANIPFNTALGLRYPCMRTDVSDTAGIISQPYFTNVQPGIMTITVAPVLGGSGGQSSSANIAGQQFYTMVRKVNSGAINSYDKTDLMMNLLAFDSCCMLYSYALRVYKTLGCYNYQNRYLPDTLLQAMKAEPSLVNQLASLRSILDSFAYKLSSINIPKVLTLLDRHSWLFEHVYKDASDSKAQLYMYMPDGFYQWTEGTDSQPTHLEYVKFDKLFGLTSSNQYVGLDELEHAVTSLLSPLLGSSDAALMNGDIAKAFSDADMVTITAAQDHEALEPVYDKEVLLQTSNLFMCGIPEIGPITQYLEVPEVGPQLQQLIHFSSGDVSGILTHIKPVLNLIDEPVNEENVMVSTRMTSMALEFVDPTNPNSGVRQAIYGTEIPTGISIYIANAPGQRPDVYKYSTSLVGYQTNGTGANSIYSAAVLFSKFDWAPQMHFATYKLGTDGLPEERQYLGNSIDICNNVFLDYEALKQLHEVAVMSEYAVKDYNYNLKK